jgi:predicted nucleotidyltransferase
MATDRVSAPPYVEPPPFLRRAVARLARAFAPRLIVLFGSYAKGVAQPGSDVDLLLVADVEGDLEHHLRRARQLVADNFPPVDLVLCSSDELSEASTARSPFLASILSSGVTVYQAVISDDRPGHRRPG